MTVTCIQLSKYNKNSVQVPERLRRLFSSEQKRVEPVEYKLIQQYGSRQGHSQFSTSKIDLFAIQVYQILGWGKKEEKSNGGQDNNSSEDTDINTGYDSNADYGDPEDGYNDLSSGEIARRRAMNTDERKELMDERDAAQVRDENRDAGITEHSARLHGITARATLDLQAGRPSGEVLEEVVERIKSECFD